MADKSTQTVLDGLARAAVDPAGLPLHGSKSVPGLFAPNAAGKQAAQRCKDEGYLRVVAADGIGKSAAEVCALTEKGLAYLLSQVSPKHVLEDFVRALEARRSQVGELVSYARQWQTGLDALKDTVEKVLQQLHKPTSVPAGHTLNGSDAWLPAVVGYLSQRRDAGAVGDCPLPELFQQARQVCPALTIGHFHDGLRGLHERGQIYLHPWTGPLYDLPEPPYALLVGHEVAYYVSPR